MDTNDLLYWTACSRIKSARRKVRLQKWYKEKQLIQLGKQRYELRKQKHALPLVPLKEPYQKGWKRFFGLREDVARCNKADFYWKLLEKINTVEYSNNKSFTVKMRKKRKRIDVVKQQYLKAFSTSEWKSSKLELSDKEKDQFVLKDVWCEFDKKYYARYVFIEPWRYVLRIKPHFITHTKMIDEVLEQQIQELKNYIENNFLDHKIDKLTRGRKDHYRCWNKNKLKYLHPFKNKALHTILYECEQEKN